MGLKDRVECIGAPKARWLNAKGKPKVRVPRKLDDIHVELMGRDYETARYNVRSQEAQMEGKPFHFMPPENTKGKIFRQPYAKDHQEGGGPDDDKDPSGDDAATTRNGDPEALRRAKMVNMGKNGPGQMGGQQGGNPMMGGGGNPMMGGGGNPMMGQGGNPMMGQGGMPGMGGGNPMMGGGGNPMMGQGGMPGMGGGMPGMGGGN